MQYKSTILQPYETMHMKRIYLLLISICFAVNAFAQKVTMDTYYPRADKAFTITVNVEGTSLQGYTDQVWIWSWLPVEGGAIDAPTNVNPAASPAQDAALMTRAANNPNEYSITLTPSTFFNKPAESITRMGLKLKSRDWEDGKQSDNDVFIDIYQGGFTARLISPDPENILIKTGESVKVHTVASAVADKIQLFLDGSPVTSVINSDHFEYLFNAETAKTTAGVVVVSKAGEENDTLRFSITVIQPSTVAAKPVGTKDGINYINDQTVILSLLAPGKDFVFVVGDFNNWMVSNSYQMKKTPDGERFWLELTGLQKGVEYAFQYLVDGKIRIADPYSDKVLDPEDKYIPTSTYPDLKPFPTALQGGEWFEKRASVIQTGQTPYEWTAKEYTAPAKEDLIIYELLIRDFFAADQRNYNNLIDTLSYLKRLGVNAIELMPITEFNGNDSWGYNPAFMFAPDKAYGTKEMLKRFVDEAHKKDIAVILDVVLNHQDMPNPYVMMYFDGSAPTADNPWFNRVATHPFNVFFDMNHESAYTKSYVDTVSHYWLNEYKFDGLRFDLSKGFTQKDNANNVDAWSAYDASRVGILKRMAEKIFSYKPEAYVILEHFGSEQEEKELSDAGMMLWSNMNWAAKDAIVGKGADFSRAHYESRNWTNNYNVSFIESHDEERVMYEAINSGQSNGDYNVKNLNTALDRVKLAASFIYLVPGPKMLWEFGELGYDYSINTCSDGSVNNDCRVAAKPVKWDYLQQEERVKLNKVYSRLFNLRHTEAFKNGEFDWDASGQQKRLSISHSSMDIVAVGNFALKSAQITPTFSSTGYWYDYLTTDSINVTVPDQEMTFAPGEFHIYTSKRINSTEEQLVPFRTQAVLAIEDKPFNSFHPYPNPGNGTFFLKSLPENSKVNVTDLSGRTISFILEKNKDGCLLKLDKVNGGVYILEVKNGRMTIQTKLIKE